MHKITLHELISRGSNWLISFPATDSSKHNVFVSFSAEEAEKKKKAKNLFFWGKSKEVLQEIWLKAEWKF